MFIRHQIIRNKKAFYRIDGRLFPVNSLFIVRHPVDWNNTMYLESLWQDTRFLHKNFCRGVGKEFVRIDPYRQDIIRNFEDATGGI